jgi:hypothetical protein
MLVAKTPSERREAAEFLEYVIIDPRSRKEAINEAAECLPLSEIATAIY